MWVNQLVRVKKYYLMIRISSDWSILKQKLLKGSTMKKKMGNKCKDKVFMRYLRYFSLKCSFIILNSTIASIILLRSQMLEQSKNTLKFLTIQYTLNKCVWWWFVLWIMLLLLRKESIILRTILNAPSKHN